jgi:UDP-N-acetylglucosamine acyltransferase
VKKDNMKIHHTALIEEGAQLHSSVEVGPYAIIHSGVKLAEGCKVLAHAQVVGNVIVGAGTIIGRAAIIGENPQDLGFEESIYSGVKIGEKNVIREQVTIHRGSKEGSWTEVGNGNFLMANVHLAHDVVVGDNNVIANQALFAGHVRLGNRTFVGGAAVFHQFLRIGDFCVIQGNGSFSKDIPHFCAAQRENLLTGLNVIGLKRQGFDNAQRQEIKEMYHLLFNAGYNLSQAIATAEKRPWGDGATKMLEFVKAPTKKGVCGSIKPQYSLDKED